MFYNLTKKISHENGKRINIQHGDIFLYVDILEDKFWSYICFDPKTIIYPSGSHGAWESIINKHLVNLYHQCIKFEDFDNKINNEYIQNNIGNGWHYYGYEAHNKEEWLDPNWRRKIEMKAFLL